MWSQVPPATPERKKSDRAEYKVASATPSPYLTHGSFSLGPLGLSQSMSVSYSLRDRSAQSTSRSAFERTYFPSSESSESEDDEFEQLADLTAETSKRNKTKRQREVIDRLRAVRQEELRTSAPRRRRGADGSLPRMPASGPARIQRTFSITISVQGSHLSEAHFNHIATWFQNGCSWGAVAREKGGTCQHWHAQGVATLETTSAVMAKNEMMRFLGWFDVNPYGRKLNTRFRPVSSGEKLDSPEGTLGYCMKDMGSYAGWVCVLHDEVNDDEIERGQHLYSMYGAPEKSVTVTLTRSNIIERALAFYKIHNRRGVLPPRCSLLRVLHAMLQSGNFRPNADWIVPRYGEGADFMRGSAMWRVLCDPSSATIEDAYAFFFHNKGLPTVEVNGQFQLPVRVASSLAVAVDDEEEGDNSPSFDNPL